MKRLLLILLIFSFPILVCSQENFGSVYLQYIPATLDVDSDDSDNVSLKGISMGANYAFGLTRDREKLPLFFETGMGIQYFHSSDYDTSVIVDGNKYYEGSSTLRLLAIKIPARLMICFAIPNTHLMISPYFGLDLRYNIIAGEKFVSPRTKIHSKYQEWFGYFDTAKAREFNYSTWNRIQAGWHMGISVRIADHFLVGLCYDPDLSEVKSKNKLIGSCITVGYTF